jgi:hypothetical protein
MKPYNLLSDAMVDGAKLRPQAFGFYTGREGETCALSAMVHAMTGDPEDAYNILEVGCYHGYLTEAQESLLNEHLETCPVENCNALIANGGVLEALKAQPTGEIVVHLNDTHEWSREQIAGWLTTIEAKLGLVEIINTESTNHLAVDEDGEALNYQAFCYQGIVGRV